MTDAIKLRAAEAPTVVHRDRIGTSMTECGRFRLRVKRSEGSWTPVTCKRCLSAFLRRVGPRQ